MSLGGILGGKKEQSSFAQYRVNEERTKVGFSEDSALLFVISPTGKFYEAQIPDQPGDCKELGQYMMIPPAIKNGQGQGGANY